MVGMVNRQTEKSDAVQIETLLTPEELAEALHLHVSQVRRIFGNEPGVINVGRGKKYQTLRIPVSVYKRYLRSRTRP